MAISNEMKRPKYGPFVDTDTDEEIRTQIREAMKQPKIEEPEAKSICFDRKTRRFSLVLKTGVELVFSADFLWEMKGQPDDVLADVTLSPSGGTICWEQADMHTSVPGLVLDLFGAPEWKKAIRSAYARELGSIPSEARAAAARENGKKGGRPRKSVAEGTPVATARLKSPKKV